MAFSPLPLSWDADEIEQLFNSVLSPEYYAYLCGNSWSAGTVKREIEQSPFILEIDTYMDSSLATEEMSAPHLFEAAESSLVSTERPVNDETAAGQDPERGDPRTTTHRALSNAVVEEQNATGRKADQEDISLATSPKACPSLLFEKVCLSTSADAEIRPEYEPEAQAGDMEEPINSDRTHATCPIEDEKVPTELANVTIEDVTGVQAIQNEGDAYEHVYQDQEIKAAIGAGTDLDSEASPNGICPSHQGNHEVSSGNATPGSKDNPMLLDDDEEPPRPSSLQSTPTATSINDSSVDGSDESSQATAHSSGRPVRQKRKRSLDGMQAWGSVEFQESETEQLQSAWLSVQIRWCAIETLVSELKGYNCHLERLATNFNACWFAFCVKVKHSRSIDLSSVAELIDHWKKMEQELKKVQGSGKKKRKVLEFGQTLDWLEDKTVFYDCIEEYSNSADRKDEDKDGDFEDEEIRRPSKTRRR